MDFELLTIDERLGKYELMLNVALSDEEIIPLLTEFGYSTEVVNQGKQLFDTAFELNQTQKREYGEQYGATDELRVARKDAYEKYITLVKLARIALKNDRDLLSRLELNGKRQKSYEKLVAQMESFYKGALSETKVQEGLARFNITPEKLEAAKNLMEVMKEKYQTQKKETSEAQRATKDRDAAMESLDDWMSDFIGVAKIALTAEPQYIERMGIVEPS